MKSPIPNSLKEYRLKAGLLQIQVAEMLNLLSSDRISRWEHGLSMPDSINLFRLARIYNAFPHELYRDIYSTIMSGMNPRAILSAEQDSPA